MWRCLTCRSRLRTSSLTPLAENEEDTMTQTQLQKSGEERLDVGGGLTMFVRCWRPEASARGLVVIVPGFNSHSGYYCWGAEELGAARGNVYAGGLRGRG